MTTAAGKESCAAKLKHEVLIEKRPKADDRIDLVAQDMPFVASLAFGEGEFNEGALYATQLIGGSVWEVDLGVRGAPMVR